MEDVYRLAAISRQGHHQHLSYEARKAAKIPCYIGLVATYRELEPGAGLRRIYEYLQPEGIGRDAFMALGKAHGLILDPPKSATPRTTESNPYARFENILAVQNRFTDVNQVWVTDITYYTALERHYYLVFIMDAYSRRIIGYHTGKNMTAECNIAALQMALKSREVLDYQDQLIHHSDRGSQYISDAYTDMLYQHNILVSMCDNVLENAHIERVHGTIKNQYLAHRSIKTFDELCYWVDGAVKDYNRRRPHSALKVNGKKLAPVQFEAYVKELAADKRPVIELFVYQKSEKKSQEKVE